MSPTPRPPPPAQRLPRIPPSASPRAPSPWLSAAAQRLAAAAAAAAAAAGSVIPAISLGMEGMRVGGVRRITSPPEFAYG